MRCHEVHRSTQVYECRASSCLTNGVWLEEAVRKKSEWAYNANCVYAIEPGVLAFLDLGEDEFVEAFGARLFHAFEAEANVYGKGLVESMVCVEHVNPAKDGTFVIA
jgi:hypothetical protein